MKKIRAFFSSISTKLMLLIVIGIFVLAVSLVTICIILMSDMITQSAATQMNLYCDERASDIDAEFLRIEDAVSFLSRWTSSKIPDAETFAKDPEMRASLIEDVEDLIRFTTDGNEFIQSIYIYYTIDITGLEDREEGVYYSRGEDGHFTTISFTQNDIVEDPVAEYWYYGPIKNREALWTKPYYDESIDDYLISYVQPIYMEETPVAVIGIDASFSRLLEWIDALSYHDTGYMYLKEADGSVHYHLSYLKQEDLHGDEEDELLDNAGLIEHEKTGDKLIHYHFRGGNRLMAFVTLRNGMKFVLCDGYESTYKERNNTVIIMVIVSIVLAIVFAGAAAVMASRIINPLRKLTAAANEISNGNYDIELPLEKTDEVGELSKNFRLAVDKIRAREEEVRAYVKEQDMRIQRDSQMLKDQESDLTAMRNLVYADALTNVKNKTAYEETVEYIEGQIKSGVAKFAVIMCDMNYLKQINDNFGHNAGDQAIIKASRILCQAFPMSTVFRIGGDEFAVIAVGVEYERLDELLVIMNNLLEQERRVSDNIFKRISLAVGIAVYDPKNDRSYNDVFERADEKMYEDKRRLHTLDGFTGSRHNMK